MQDPLSEEALLADAIRGAGTPSFMPELSDYMRSLVTFRGILVVLLRHGGDPEHIYDNVRVERRAIVVDRWLDRAWHLDPFVAAYQKGKSDPVVMLDDVAPDRFSQSTYYHTYYQSVRLKDEMALYVEVPTGTLFFSLGRLAGERRFSRRDARVFERQHNVLSALCEQHFSRAYQTSSPSSSDFSFKSLAAGALTERETEIVRLILRGHSSRSAALLLDVSPATIKVHRKNIYRKLGISSQSQLFALFLETSGTP